MRRLTIALLAVLTALLGTAPAAHSYPIGVAPNLTASSGIVGPGDTYTMFASAFCPGQTVSFYQNGVFEGSAVASAGGNASLPGVVAPSVVGEYQLKAEATGCDQVLDQAFSTLLVRTGTLPDTGGGDGAPLQAAVIVFLAGGGLAAVAIRRRRRPAFA